MTRASFPALVAADGARTLRQPATRVLAGILVGYVAIIIVALASIVRGAEAGDLQTTGLEEILREDAIGFVLQVAGGIATILLVVLASQATGQEFSRGTLRTLLVSRARRGDLLLAKLAVLGIAVLASALVVLVGSVVGAWAFSVALREDLLRVDASDLILALLRQIAALTAWTAIAFGVTLATRSTGVGIGVTLGSLLVGDVVGGLLGTLGDIGVWAGRALPNAAVTAVASSSGVAASDWAWIAPNLALYVVGLNAYAWWRFLGLDVIAATK